MPKGPFLTRAFQMSSTWNEMLYLYLDIEIQNVDGSRLLRSAKGTLASYLTVSENRIGRGAPRISWALNEAHLQVARLTRHFLFLFTPLRCPISDIFNDLTGPLCARS